MLIGTEPTLKERVQATADKYGLGYIEYDSKDIPVTPAERGYSRSPMLSYYPDSEQIVLSSMVRSTANALKQRLAIRGLKAHQESSGGPLTFTINTHEKMDLLGAEIDREFRGRKPYSPPPPPQAGDAEPNGNPLEKRINTAATRLASKLHFSYTVRSLHRYEPLVSPPNLTDYLPQVTFLPDESNATINNLAPSEARALKARLDMRGIQSEVKGTSEMKVAVKSPEDMEHMCEMVGALLRSRQEQKKLER